MFSRTVNWFRGNGAPREEARRQALMETGGIEQIKEDVWKAWLGQAIETTFQDIRYACRSLRRSPGFSAIVAATIALGICATLTMFSLMRAVLWRPLPYPEPNRIVTIQVDAHHVSNVGTTPGELLDLKERSRSLEQVSMIDSGDANLEYLGETERVAAATVSDDFLPLLGAKPALGRTLDSRIDEGNQQALAILISDDLWRRRFSADPGVIGRAVRLDDAAVQIAGVLAPGFRLFLPPSVNASEQVDVWLPYRMSARGGTAAFPSWRGSGPAFPSVMRTPSCKLWRRNSSVSSRNSIPAAKDGWHRHTTAGPASKSGSRPASCMRK